MALGAGVRIGDAMTSSSRADRGSIRSTAPAGGHWARIGRSAGRVTAFCLFGQTILFLADASGLLGEDPQYTDTPAGRAHDLANYYVAYFEHQHALLWDIAVRDALGPIAFLALMVLGVAVLNAVGPWRPEAQLLVLFVVGGGLLAAIADLTYLTLSSYWRHSGWEATPTANMIALGRSVEAIHELTTYPQNAGFIVLALGLGCLGRLCRRDVGLSSGLGILATVQAVTLAGIAMSSIIRNDTAYNILALAAGAVLGPAVAIWLGRDIVRRESAAASPPSQHRRT